MLYAVLKPIVTVALRLYFRRVNRNGLQHIDNGQPTLILANHTASFMDAILVACFVRRRIHFFARGDVFGKKWADRVLRSIGLLPVYRLSEGRDKMHLNDTSNDEALEILREGGSVLIFCEGTSNTAKRLKPLKKGPFRLAATAAATLPIAPLIVPLGINYITPTEPGEDVFLEAGAPMSTADFLTGDDEAVLAKAATGMMRQTDAVLNTLAWHTAREEDEPLAGTLLRLLQDTRPNYSFSDTQHLMQRLNIASDEERKQLSLTPEQTRVGKRHTYRASRPVAIWEVLLLVVLSPIALVGYLFHLPVIWLANRITKHAVDAADFIAPVFLSCALSLMVLWYVICFAIAGILYPSLIWLAILVIVAVSGILFRKVYLPTFRRLVQWSKIKGLGMRHQFISNALRPEG